MNEPTHLATRRPYIVREGGLRTRGGKYVPGWEVVCAHKLRRIRFCTEKWEALQLADNASARWWATR